MTRSSDKPQVLPPPPALPVLGPLVVMEGDCPYFDDRRAATVFAVPGALSRSDYRQAMSLGMRRSGALAYRPVCEGCRKCQPFRLDVEAFSASRSQRRVQKRCDGLFTVQVGAPRLDDERLKLYAQYQRDQHGPDGQSADAESYERFLCESMTETMELAWRDASGRLCAVGVVDVVDDGLSTVYFYWDPALRDLSLGVYSALYEIDLCRKSGLRYYYLGYLVPGASTMGYKAGFGGGQLWDGTSWVPVGARDVEDAGFAEQLKAAEGQAMVADAANFGLVRIGPRHSIGR